MKEKKIFRVGKHVKSFYNEDVFRIEGMCRPSRKENKYLISLISLSNGYKVAKCCSYEEFADNYYLIEKEGTLKVGDKLKYKGHVNHAVFSIDFIYQFEHQEGLCDFYLKSESTDVVINYVGTEEELLQKYELLKGSVEMKKDNKPFSEFKSNVQFTIDEQELLVINKDLMDIERQGDIDRLLEIGEFEKIRSYLAE